MQNLSDMNGRMQSGGFRYCHLAFSLLDQAENDKAYTEILLDEKCEKLAARKRSLKICLSLITQPCALITSLRVIIT